MAEPHLSGAQAGAAQDQTIWTRLLFMALFGVIGYTVFWLSLFSAVLQFIVRVVTGSVNEDLAQLSGKLTGYLGEVLAFVTFQTESKPFPFDDADKRDVTVK